MADKKYLIDVDLNKNQVKNFVEDNLSSAPANPVEGQRYYNTTLKKSYYYNGTSWVTGGNFRSLLECFWSDHILNDTSYVRADTFSWYDGTTYSQVYNELLSEYNNASSVEETEGSITFKRTPKGYKIALVNEESDINLLYGSTGIAWYYILDTTNIQFKLPRTKWGFKGLRNHSGDSLGESLPNITGNLKIGNNSGGGGWFGDSALSTGCFVPSTYASTATFASNTYAGSGYATTNFDASKSSPVYQNGAPVQERGTEMYLYFYVGQFSQSAIEQTAGITTEAMSRKVETDLSNLNLNNLSTANKSIITDIAAPSNRTVNLTLGASGSTYVAPGNGWITLRATMGNTGFINMTNNTNLICYITNHNNARDNGISIRVKKGDIVQIDYAAAVSTLYWFKFIYDSGDV